MGDYRREIEFWHRTWAKNTPRCPGYGERKGKCDSWPIRGGEYCPDCTIAMLKERRVADESTVYGNDCPTGKCEM